MSWFSLQCAYGMTVNIFVSLNISTLAWCITWGLLLCWQKYKLSALVRYRQSSRAERQLRKISLHLFIKFFIGHLQPGWKLENPAQQASPVRYTQAKEGAIRLCWAMWLEDGFRFASLSVRRVVPLTFLLNFTVDGVLILITPALITFCRCISLDK